MRKTRTAAIILIAGLFLWGCGGNGTDNNDMDMEVEAAEALTAELEVRKDGAIVETLVEDFSKKYYNEESLKNMILSEVADFNKAHGDTAISVDKLEQKNGEITLQMIYPSAKIYSEYNTNEYNQKSLFCGTLAEAYDAGHSLDISMQDTKGENTIGKEELLEMGEQNILISETPMRVKVPGRIQYVSSNVAVDGKSEARMLGNEETVEKYYIVYK